MRPDDAGPPPGNAGGRVATFLRAADWPARAGGILATLLILFVAGLTCLAVAQRYLLGAPLLWSDELAGYLLVTLVMAGLAEAYRRGDHIAIDLVTGRLSAGGRRAVAIWSDLAVLAVAIVLGLSAWDAVTFARAFGAYPAGEIQVPTWILQVPLIGGAALLALAALTRLLTRLAGPAAGSRAE
ncbi:TRAP transporter small permease [Marinibaculum pumilum]|uniref:TRAP transporter small permease protein n=1 Tax=Marinibaculum pumilum TaxID=1766165 RepID=A0ABV7KZH8_9PROT